MELEDIKRLIRENAEANERNEQMLAEFASMFETLLTVLQKQGELDEGHLRLIAKLRKRARVVSEPQLERALSLLISIEKTVVEGAGAAGLAALIAAPERFKGRKVGLVLCGGKMKYDVAALRQFNKLILFEYRSQGGLDAEFFQELIILLLGLRVRLAE